MTGKSTTDTSSSEQGAVEALYDARAKEHPQAAI